MIFSINFLCLAAVKSVCSLWSTGLWWWEFYFHEISIISTWLRLPIWCADQYRCNVRLDVNWKKSNVIANEIVKRAIFYSKNVYFVSIFVVDKAGFMGCSEIFVGGKAMKTYAPRAPHFHHAPHASYFPLASPHASFSSHTK